ncbi:MAG: hypothetical protein AABY22_31615 [Nanoarchaeota archaeon]
MKKTYEIGGHKQIINKGNITCSCRHSVFNPTAYKEGKPVCKHIKQLIKKLNGKKFTKFK